MDKIKIIRLIAEGVMEWEIDERDGEWIKGDEQREYYADWNPLEDWNDCIRVVEKMVKDRFRIRLVFNEHILSNSAHFTRVDWDDKNKVNEVSQGLSSSHKDMKEAICIAALKARGIEVNE